MSEHARQIAEIVRTVAKLKAPELDPDATLKDLGVDSLEVMNVFLVISEKYAVDIPDEKIDELDTINKIVAFLGSK